MTTSSNDQPEKLADKALSREKFDQMAEWLEVDSDIRDELFPMAQDLLVFAHQLNQLAAGPGQEIGADSFGVHAKGGEQ